jgi:glc operon protein GlcG
VVDDAGYLLYLERLDGAGPVTAEVATEKAITAARTRRSSKFWEDRIKERPSFGAIGVSGVQSHEDEQIANAGAGALA